MEVIVKKPASWMEAQRKSITLGIFLNGVGFDEFDALEGIKVAAELLAHDLGAEWEDFESAEPGGADIRIIFVVDKFPAFCGAVNIRKVIKQVLVKGGADRLKRLHARIIEAGRIAAI